MVARCSRRFGLSVAVALVGLGVGVPEARAQRPIGIFSRNLVSGREAAANVPVIPPGGVTPTTTAAGGSGPTYATPPFSDSRRQARTANRYTVARPVYNGRPGVSFAPYSDYYFPRTIGSKETVYTVAPGGSVPVGEAAFRRAPGTRGSIFSR